ncbi:hypothetical protein A1O3_04698 [Capronia epimyces CBS 606.96]|uniref:Ribosome biogenesis protein Alb1 n=1 Tax=Capronia epimyces CBS 606.96 TaxID=1182542 RepID=W9Y491_9EURO|nr:uncharacterized protein A1O3_04698 [Capronia epimyces CBS 606.96]EXJ84031.1 hypothetical protein A1O3_04698 [Capronia epimyces CBS 606.96]
MGKTGKVKQKSTANPRSRASKRATSPSIDVDKSLKDTPRASDATPILSAHPNGGVTKPKRKQKQLTRGQRKRHEKELARAQAVQDHLAKKVNDATVKLKKRRERKGVWDEVNSTTKFEQTRAILDEATDQPEGSEWEDEVMEEVDIVQQSDLKIIEGSFLPSKTPASKLVVVDRTVSAHATDVEDEADKIT